MSADVCTREAELLECVAVTVAWASRRLPPSVDLEDLGQDLAEEALRALPRYDAGRGGLPGFLRRRLQGQVTDLSRRYVGRGKTKRPFEIEFECLESRSGRRSHTAGETFAWFQEPQQQDVVDHLVAVETRCSVHQVLLALPARLRGVLLLHHGYGIPAAEISRRRGHRTTWRMEQTRVEIRRAEALFRKHWLALRAQEGAREGEAIA